eukprot:scaffold324008_cov68-Tisochrysis_lutea.AAC.2
MLETLYRYCCCCPEYLRRDRGYAARGRKVLDEIEMEFVDDPDDLDEGLYDMTSSPDKRVALPVTSDNYGPSAVSETRSQPGTDRGAKSAGSEHAECGAERRFKGVLLQAAGEKQKRARASGDA